MEPASDRVTRETSKNSEESQRLSLNHVAKETRIREAVLRAIEEDRYEDLPQLYVKSFLSTYARCLGVDPNDVTQLHQKYVKDLPPSTGKVPRRRMVARKRTVKARLLVILISAVLLVAVLIYAAFRILY